MSRGLYAICEFDPQVSDFHYYKVCCISIYEGVPEILAGFKRSEGNGVRYFTRPVSLVPQEWFQTAEMRKKERARKKKLI